MLNQKGVIIKNVNKLLEHQSEDNGHNLVPGATLTKSKVNRSFTELRNFQKFKLKIKKTFF